MVSIDHTDVEVLNAECDSIDKPQAHWICVGVRDVGGPSGGDKSQSPPHTRVAEIARERGYMSSGEL